MPAARTNFCCRNGGSNLNPGTRIGNTTIPGTSYDLEYALGSWVSGTGVFTVASGNPSSDGVAVGDFASVFGSAQSETFSDSSGALPGNFTQRWTSTNVTWSEDAGGFLRATVTAANRRGTSFDTYAPTDGNVEILTKIRYSTAPSGTVNYMGVLARGSGSAGSENAYYAQLIVASGTTQVSLQRIVSGAATSIAVANFTWTNNTWYWMRFRVVGSGLQVRVWADGGSEPSTWNLTATDTNIAATSTGYSGLYIGNTVSSGTIDWDSIEVTPLTWTRLGRVTARDATTITVSTTVGVGTVADGTSNRTLRIGGAMAGPEGGTGFPFNVITNAVTNSNGDLPRINVKADLSLSITAAINNIPADLAIAAFDTAYEDDGMVSLSGPTTGLAINLFGQTVGNNAHLSGFILSNNGATSAGTGLFWNSAGGTVERCVVHDVRGHGFQSNSSTRFIECEAYACNQSNSAGLAGFNLLASATAIRCVSHDHSAGSNCHGFAVTGMAMLIECTADACAGVGFLISISGITLKNCDAYNNTGNGLTFTIGTNSSIYIENSNFVKNGGYGIQGAGAGIKSGHIVNCGFGGGAQANTSGTINAMGAIEESGTVQYANDVTPWRDPANGDFTVTLPEAIDAGRGSFTQTATSYAGTTSTPGIGASQARSRNPIGRLTQTRNIGTF